MSRGVTSLINPGDLLVVGQTLGEPTTLLREVFASTAGIPGLRLFGGMSLTGIFSEAPDGMALSTFVGMGRSTDLVASGRMDLVPCHMSDLAWNMRQGPLRPDVAVITVSPPDERGSCSLGVVSDYIWSAVAGARTVLAEVNERMPRIPGDTEIPLERLDFQLHTNHPLPQHARVAPTEVDRAIAAHIAPYIPDGACLQIGVGRLGDAVLEAVAGRRDLGVHSGMVGDTVLEMAANGIVTNGGKTAGGRCTVAGSVLGSALAVTLAAADRRLRIRSVDHLNDPGVVSGLGHVVCVNSAVEVDLLGQVNSEVADGRYVGGIGGSVDFLRASVRSGGRSIVALPATAGRGSVSRIVPTVQRVTATRSDVDMVVTEHGVADLRGVSVGERAARLIRLAAPHHREHLRAATRQIGL